jgi:hypothetical protein
VFDSFTVIVLFTPTATLPKETDGGFTERVAVGEALPLPESVTTAGEFEALLVIVAVPLAAPTAEGVKTIGIAALPPTAIMSGKDIFPSENPAPVKTMPPAGIVTALCPAFVAVTDIVLLPPTPTVPNDRVVGATFREAPPVFVTPVPVNAIVV